MQVADAVYESVLPRKAGDETAASPAGILLSVADRCHHSVCSSSDPASCQPELRICTIFVPPCTSRVGLIESGIAGAVSKWLLSCGVRMVTFR